MSAYTLYKVPGEPIVVLSLSKDFKVAQDVPQIKEEITPLFDASEQDVYYVSDARELTVNFSDVVMGLSMITKGEMAFVKHPKVKAVLIVTGNDLIRLGGSALNQVQYGSKPTKIFESVEQALDYARKDMQLKPNS